MQFLDRKQSVVLLVSFNLQSLKDSEVVCAILTLRHTLLRYGLDYEKEVKDQLSHFPFMIFNVSTMEFTHADNVNECFNSLTAANSVLCSLSIWLCALFPAIFILLVHASLT